MGTTFSIKKKNKINSSIKALMLLKHSFFAIFWTTAGSRIKSFSSVLPSRLVCSQLFWTTGSLLLFLLARPYWWLQRRCWWWLLNANVFNNYRVFRVNVVWGWVNKKWNMKFDIFLCVNSSNRLTFDALCSMHSKWDDSTCKPSTQSGCPYEFWTKYECVCGVSKGVRQWRWYPVKQDVSFMSWW